jgi:uncharacterized OB-fold protein
MSDPTVTVEALRCQSCGTLDPGPRELCRICFSADLRACSVPGDGQLVSWTTVRRAPTRFKGQAPYTVAVVDLDAGVRVTGRLRGSHDSLRVGAPVAATALEGGAYVFEETGR